MTGPGRGARLAYATYAVVIMAILYLPLVAAGFASASRGRFLSFPIRRYTWDWYISAWQSETIAQLVVTSLKVAISSSLIAVLIGFFAALAFARYQWRFRGLFQKLVLLPIIFPQAVLGLALLLWFNALGIAPSWKTAVVAHTLWTAPIATLIIAIRAYSFDPALEAAARDLGASPQQVMRLVTVPLLAPGLVTAWLFAFLLSWGNFPLSAFTTGVDQTLPEWLYGRMVSGYTPLVPAVGMLTIAASLGTLVTVAGLLVGLRAIRRRQPRPQARSD